MIEGSSAMVQALLGGLFTWGLTALGAAAVFAPFKTQNKKLLDCSLGFAGGVMTAASFWSLLAPAIERAEEYNGKYAFIPVSFGFLAGAAFVFGADAVLPFLGFSSDDMVAAFLADNPPPPPVSTGRPSERALQQLTKQQHEQEAREHRQSTSSYTTAVTGNKTAEEEAIQLQSAGVRLRRAAAQPEHAEIELQDSPIAFEPSSERESIEQRVLSWRRVLLLIVAITVHNVPEGLAVGVGFGAIGKASSATFESAVSLAIGIGIQNFPEGMAVSLPLVGFGYSRSRAFMYGQLSGMVEPVAALMGAAIVTWMEPVLPYALAFAAGAMIYVVFDDIVPEAQLHGNGRLASWSAIVGFIVMMSLDVSLG